MLGRKSALTNDRYLKLAVAFLVSSGLLASGVCAAKSQVIRIDVMRGKAPLASIEAPLAGEFTIWSGPGTQVTTGGETRAGSSDGDIADWQHGAVPAPPAGRAVYDVVFLCEACEPARGAAWRCYGVRYAPGGPGAPGLIQIPAAGDPDFPGNLKTIYRGVEGQWFRASPRWEAIVRERIQGLSAL
jgi:hypothetical protein